MKSALLTAATLLVLLTPLSILAHPNPNPPTVLRKCMPLLGDIGEDEAWFIANLHVRKMDLTGVDVIQLPMSVSVLEQLVCY
ncbi:hypothetical protein Aspvir_008383 [Aspergillus viridinutans]|uniref:Uncharacterized protein n=1 Tax=Aspergillus viridinutans TaxID=75553 RepID=A0A9P3F433_ASPVI|nr:uncharacterized protein Aspvir_008383 [Aspergillus viridinutans]GIK04304.1 hypothetical protein Aspvir_008383 [Aspergillus viridinutans]